MRGRGRERERGKLADRGTASHDGAGRLALRITVGDS